VTDELATTVDHLRDATPGIAWRGVSVELGRRPVLTDVDLEAASGSWLAVIGPNGAGKTTLLRALAGQIDHEGSIAIGGHDVRTLRTRERAALVAVVPQIPVIPPGVEVFDYVLLGRAPHQGIRYAASAEDRRLTLAVLQRLDLDELAGRRLETLSGGERQRVIIARALAQDTSVLVLDEPTTSLDVGHQLEVMELVGDLRRERGLTVVSTVHDLGLAGQFADRVALLSRGRVVAHGTPEEVLTPALIGEHYGVDARVARDGRGGVIVTVHRRREPPRGPAGRSGAPQ
jgi:cobalamin transport system ATP-binding protein